MVLTLRSSSELGFGHGVLDSLLSGIVEAAASKSSDDSLGYTARPEQQQTLELLERRGLACCTGRDDTRWFSTDQGVKELTSIVKVAS